MPGQRYRLIKRPGAGWHCHLCCSVQWQTKANGLYTEVEDRKNGEMRLELYRQKKPYRDVD